jgi:hypothetical protein
LLIKQSLEEDVYHQPAEKIAHFYEEEMGCGLFDNWTEDGCKGEHLMEGEVLELGLEKTVTGDEAEDGCELSKEIVAEIERARSQILKMGHCEKKKKRKICLGPYRGRNTEKA